MEYFQFLLSLIIFFFQSGPAVFLWGYPSTLMQHLPTGSLYPFSPRNPFPHQSINYHHYYSLIYFYF